MGFQIILSGLILVALIRLSVQFYKKHINSFVLLFFLAIWGVVLFLTWNAGLLNKFGRLLGIERGATILVYIGLFMLFYYVFVSMLKFYKLEQNIDKLVKKDAIRNFLERYNLK